MKTQWYKGLDEDAKSEMVSHYKSAVLLRNRMTKIVEDKIESKDRASMDLEDYDGANWAYKQADAQGYKRAMREILSLLE